MNVGLSQQVERIFDIEGISDNYWYVNGITSTKRRDLVISGGATDKQSFITAISTQGNIIKQRVFKPIGAEWPSPQCDCAPFDQSKVAIACDPDEIGLFDVRNESYSATKLRDVIHGWSPDHVVRCIATDVANNYVIVGCANSRDVYLLDDELGHQRTVTLPEMITWPRAITVKDGDLLVCDEDGNRACAVNINGELLYEFIKPDIEGCDKPLSVCTDSNGFIYILWVDKAYVIIDHSCVVAQYSRDGRHLLMSTSMYTSARCITTAEIDQTQKLLVATLQTGKIHVYGLNNMMMPGVEGIEKERRGSGSGQRGRGSVQRGRRSGRRGRGTAKRLTKTTRSTKERQTTAS